MSLVDDDVGTVTVTADEVRQESQDRDSVIETGGDVDIESNVIREQRCHVDF
jgi:hypothetical protein